MTLRREAVLGAFAALATAAALPAVAARSPAVREFVLWTAPRLPSFLFAAAILGGAAETVRSWRARTSGLVPPWSPLLPSWRRLAAAILPAAAIASFMLHLIYVWSTAPSEGYSLFGLLPRSDAASYYLGARHLLETGRLDDWNCRRPLNAALLAVRLAATGNGLQAVQVTQVVLLSLAAYALSRTIAKDLGRFAGLLVFSLLLAYGGAYSHWLSSEWLGLTLGALAAAHLWDGARDGRNALLAWGLAMMTLALNARAGTFLVLPALVLWSGFGRRGKAMVRWSAVALSVAGILAGFALNTSIMTINGNRPALGNGNFSLTLYGLASGNPGWTRIYRDYPETRHMAERELNRFAYERSYERIAREPSLLMDSLEKASGMAVREFPQLRGWWATLARDPAARRVLLLVLAVGGLVFLVRARGRPEITMVSAALAGFLASVPFLWIDGEPRVYAATFPVPAVFLALGICAWKRTDGLFPAAAAPSSDRSRRGSSLAVASAALVAVAVVGPPLAFRATGSGSVFSVRGSDARETVVMRSDAPHIVVLGRGSDEPTFVPRVRRFDFVRHSPDPQREDFLRLPRPGAVFFARDWAVPEPAGGRDRYVWVLGPSAMAEGPPRYLLLRGTYRRETNVFHVSGFSVLSDLHGGPGGP